ncbi:A disintegrin and metalloproteinase with thrombospondin motifs 16-like [Venturia canescens]|uniref:A disintegrin and metalloproteinase with thrombospondin motifs 16-like n=1 Tax=Venturia canescens TaxID=32260 RepID=UPI001C9D2849|nr:A disintegrin and metalloproteinase with thrombospondin motifs 16-like [Venturia canescens]
MVLKSIIRFLNLLGILAIATSAFSSNIHEQMTSAEIFETFGSDSIPDYQVFEVTLPGMRRKRNVDKEFRMSFELNGTKVDLKLKSTEGHLASKYTPVWLAISDPKAYNSIRYEPQPNALTDIGEFRMFHDLSKDAAVVVYKDPEHGLIMEGIVTQSFAIKSLPKRLVNEVLKVGEHVIERPVSKRSMGEFNVEEETSYYAVFAVEPPPKNAKRSAAVNPAEFYRVKKAYRGCRQYAPPVVYPEILLVLDHNALRNHTMTQVLRFVLAFWNGVDMTYASLSRPKVRLNIAGIIVAADDNATPYITENASDKFIVNAEGKLLKKIGAYFYKEHARFPFRHYDMVMAMTTATMCEKGSDPCTVYLGVATIEAACTLHEYAQKSKAIWSTGIFHFDWNYGGVITAAHEAAHLFGVHHDIGFKYGGRNRCNLDDGYAMTPATEYIRHGFKWSRCSIDDFRKYFSSADSGCLDNTPLWMKPVAEILPGRWLTLHGQCRNDGMEKGCEVPNVPICYVKGCKAEGSDECVPNQWQTLLGTKCGDNKFCNSKRLCVKN